MKPNIRDFLAWGCQYAKKDGIPESALFVIPFADVGKYIAHYLLGTIWTKCTRANIKAAWNRHYSAQYSWEEFDKLTADWKADERATDCEGLNDAFFRYIWEGGDGKTDVSANYAYLAWCGEKGKITDYKTLPLGAAVFKDKDGQKTHIGFICGFDGDEPLVLEAQNFLCGVRINYLKERPVFTYYGIMDEKYDYAEPEPVPEYPAEPIPLVITKPVMESEGIATLQYALNLLGYKDGNGNALVVDGKYGKLTKQAVDNFIQLNGEPPAVHSVNLEIDGCIVFTGEI